MGTPVKGVDKTNENKLMSCDFELRGKVPQVAFELFAVAQAQIRGLCGYVTQVSEDCFKGVLQGEGKLIEAFHKVIEQAQQFAQIIKEFIMTNFKVIEEYTYKTFEVRKNEERS